MPKLFYIVVHPNNKVHPESTMGFSDSSLSTQATSTMPKLTCNKVHPKSTKGKTGFFRIPILNLFPRRKTAIQEQPPRSSFPPSLSQQAQRVQVRSVPHSLPKSSERSVAEQGTRATQKQTIVAHSWPSGCRMEFTIEHVLDGDALDKSYAVTSWAKLPFAMQMLDKKDFLREVSIMMKHGHHRNVLGLRAGFIGEKTCGLITPRARMDLNTLLTKTDIPQQQPNVLQQAMLGILLGLKYLHGQGIAHLDLSPFNVLVFTSAIDSENRLVGGRQLDASCFCLAGFVKTRVAKGCATGDRRVKLENVGGMPAQYAPELAVRACEDARPADIWRLGVLLNFFALHNYTEVFLKRQQHLRNGDQAAGEQVMFDYFEILRGAKHQTEEERLICSLLLDLLRMEAAERPTASQVLEHPWFQYQYKV